MNMRKRCSESVRRQMCRWATALRGLLLQFFEVWGSYIHSPPPLPLLLGASGMKETEVHRLDLDWIGLKSHLLLVLRSLLTSTTQLLEMRGKPRGKCLSWLESKWWFSVSYDLFSFILAEYLENTLRKCQERVPLKVFPILFYLFLCFLITAAIHQHAESLLHVQVTNSSLHEIGLTL